MTFDEILPVIRAGGKARRRLWAELSGHVGIHIELLTLDKLGPALGCPLPDGRTVLFASSQWDILADDWELLP